MIRRSHASFPSRRRGSVLIVVLWASIGLVSVALLFGNSMMMNYRGVDNDTAGRQADAAIDGAIRYAQVLLAEAETPGALPELTTYEGEAVPLGDATFWFLGRADNDPNGTTRDYALVDEAARINLNTADYDTLMALPGMTEDIESAIEEYRTQSNNSVASTTAKGGKFESVDELGLVAGMTRTLLYGEDTNGNGVLDANEDDGETSPPDDNADGKLDPGFAEYLTVFTKESDKQANGDDRIDVTTLTSTGAIQRVLDMIEETLPESVPPSIAPQPYTSVLDFLARSGIRNSLSDEECDKIAPNLAASDPRNPGKLIVEGLVNVNTASEAVLAALLDEATAADIVAERSTRTLPSTGFAWVVDVIDPQILAGAGRFLTGQTFQVSADVAAVGRHGRGYRRTRVVFDTTGVAAGTLPTIIYRRDLGSLGWALGREAREQLALKKEVR